MSIALHAIRMKRSCVLCLIFFKHFVMVDVSGKRQMADTAKARDECWKIF